MFQCFQRNYLSLSRGSWSVLRNTHCHKLSSGAQIAPRKEMEIAQCTRMVCWFCMLRSLGILNKVEDLTSLIITRLLYHISPWLPSCLSSLRQARLRGAVWVRLPVGISMTVCSLTYLYRLLYCSICCYHHHLRFPVVCGWKKEFHRSSCRYHSRCSGYHAYQRGGRDAQYAWKVSCWSGLDRPGSGIAGPYIIPIGFSPVG